MSKEAMKLALEALKYDADYDTSVTLQKAAIYALENAIAEVEKQEPYADVVSHWHYWMAEADKYRFALQNLEEALAKQEQGEPVAWKGLTDDEKFKIWQETETDNRMVLIDVVEAELMLKNGVQDPVGEWVSDKEWCSAPQLKQEQGEPVGTDVEWLARRTQAAYEAGRLDGVKITLDEWAKSEPPQQLTWVGLNNDDWIRIYNHADKSAGRAAELAEEILKEKNT